MKLYHLVAMLLAALAVFEIVCLDIEAELKFTESVRHRVVDQSSTALAEINKGE